MGGFEGHDVKYLNFACSVPAVNGRGFIEVMLYSASSTLKNQSFTTTEKGFLEKLSITDLF